MRATTWAFASGIVVASGLLALDACVGDDPVTSGAPTDDGGSGSDAPSSADGTGGPSDGAPSDSGTPVDICADASGKFGAQRALPFVGRNNGIVGLSNNGHAIVGMYRTSAQYAPDAGVITGTGTTEEAVAVRFDNNANVVWQQHFGGDSSDQLVAVTADEQDNVYVAGWFESTSFTIGSFSFSNPTSASLGIVAKLDAATGTPVWAKSFVPGSFGYGCGTIDYANGHLVVSCSMGQSQAHTLKDGGAAVLSSGQVAAAAVYELDTTSGGTVWAHSFSTNGGLDASVGTAVDSVDVTATGTVVAGVFSGGTLTEKPASAINVPMVGAKNNGFVTELSVQTGAPTWAKGFADSSGTGQIKSASAAGSSTTGIVVGGAYSGTLDVGVGPHASVGGNDAYLMLLQNKAGPASWDFYFSGSGTDEIGRVRFDACGRAEALLFTTSILSPINGVSLPAPQAGSAGAVAITKLDPSGKLLWANGVTPGGNDDQNGINGVDFGVDLATNQTRLIGDFHGAVDLGNGTPVNLGAGGHPYVVVYGP